jgi:hypothetical protein
MGRAVVGPPARPSAKAVSAGRKLSGLPTGTLTNPSPSPGLTGSKGDQGFEGATGTKGEIGESYISGGRKTWGLNFGMGSCANDRKTKKH